MLKITKQFFKWVLIFTLFQTRWVIAEQAHTRLVSNDCIIEPSRVVNISSPVEGILRKITVERGDQVKAQQIIARLDARVEQASVVLAKEKANFNQRKVQRNKALYAKKLISIHDKDEMETESLISKLELRQAQAILAQRVIKTPVSGIVVNRFFNEGEFVSSDPIVKIAQINPLYVEVILPVTVIGQVKTNMKATVFPQLPVGGEYSAEVIIVDKIVDAASSTIGVRLLLPNPDNRLPAGLKCRVDFNQVVTER